MYWGLKNKNKITNHRYVNLRTGVRKKKTIEKTQNVGTMATTTRKLLVTKFSTMLTDGESTINYHPFMH